MNSKTIGSTFVVLAITVGVVSVVPAAFAQYNYNPPPAVPEFGSVASLVLAIAVVSIVVFTAKTRGIPKL